MTTAQNISREPLRLSWRPTVVLACSPLMTAEPDSWGVSASDEALMILAADEAEKQFNAQRAKRKRNSDDDDTPLSFFRPEDAFGDLSNFAQLDKSITYKGISFRTSEHLYHALKYDCVDDNDNDMNMEMMRFIAAQKTPYMAKIAANSLLGAVPQQYAWQRAIVERARALSNVQVRLIDDEMKLKLMRQTLRLKFSACSRCRRTLLSTGTKRLCEASPYDSFWGIGKSKKGANHLGQLLMDLRDELTPTT